MTIGIIGSGAIGTAFARTLARAGIEAIISNSRGSLKELVRELAPRSRPGGARKQRGPTSYSLRSTGQNCRRRWQTFQIGMGALSLTPTTRSRLHCSSRRTLPGHRQIDAFDPDVWSGRALQEVFVDLVVSGLASMYPVSSWSCFAPDHHGYQRACVLISGQASTGPCGSPVFACAGKTDPPSLLIPLADLGWKRLIGLRHRLLLISPSSFVRA